MAAPAWGSHYQLKQLQESHLQVATTLSVLMGTTLLVLFWLTADVIAGFGDLRIADVLRALSVDAVLGPRGREPRTVDAPTGYKLLRGYHRHIFGYAGVGIVLAVLGYGVWSLVMGTVTALFSALALYLLPQLHPFLARKEWLISSDSEAVSARTTPSTISYRRLDSMVIGKYLQTRRCSVSTIVPIIWLSRRSARCRRFDPVFLPMPRSRRISTAQAGLPPGGECHGLVDLPVLVGLAVRRIRHTGLYGELGTCVRRAPSCPSQECSR